MAVLTQLSKKTNLPFYVSRTSLYWCSIQWDNNTFSPVKKQFSIIINYTLVIFIREWWRSAKYRWNIGLKLSTWWKKFEQTSLSHCIYLFLHVNNSKSNKSNNCTTNNSTTNSSTTNSSTTNSSSVYYFWYSYTWGEDYVC